MANTRHKTKIFCGILILFLSACSSRASITPTPTEVLLIIPETPTPAAPECNATEIIPTPAAEEASLFPLVTKADMVRGPKESAVTIIEYGDFQ